MAGDTEPRHPALERCRLEPQAIRRAARSPNTPARAAKNVAAVVGLEVGRGFFRSATRSFQVCDPSFWGELRSSGDLRQQKPLVRPGRKCRAKALAPIPVTGTSVA